MSNILFNYDYDEPLLQSNNNIYSNECSAEYKELWDMYDATDAAFWRSTDIDFSKDSWEELKIEERRFLSLILAFFSVADQLVNINLIERFQTEIKVIEALNFFSVQQHMETTHAVVYQNALNTYIKDKYEIQKLKKSLETIPTIKKKGNWINKWTKSEHGFPIRLIAFACVEGIFFSGAFYAIFWFKTRTSKLHGLIESNKLISKDEAQHRNFACLLMKFIKHRPPVDIVYSIVKEAVELEIEFMTDAIGHNGFLGLNKTTMSEFIYMMANMLLIDLGYEPCYNVTYTYDQFPYIDQIHFDVKANFFERRVVDYSKPRHSSVSHLSVDEQEKIIKMNQIQFDIDI